MLESIYFHNLETVRLVCCSLFQSILFSRSILWFREGIREIRMINREIRSRNGNSLIIITIGTWNKTSSFQYLQFIVLNSYQHGPYRFTAIQCDDFLRVSYSLGRKFGNWEKDKISLRNTLIWRWKITLDVDNIKTWTWKLLIGLNEVCVLKIFFCYSALGTQREILSQFKSVAIVACVIYLHVSLPLNATYICGS